MLYIFCGEDTQKSSKKLQATVKQMLSKKPDASFFRIEDEKLSQDVLNEYTASVGLFEQKYIVEIGYPFVNAESGDIFLKNLDAMSESENIFLVLEGKLNKKELSKIEKKAAKVFLNENDTKDKKPDFNIFALADAIGQRNKKDAWTIYRKAVDGEIPSEEIHGIIWWQMKSMYLAGTSKSATETGLKPFVYNKSKRYFGNYNKISLETIMTSLVSMYHDAHLGKVDFELELEKFILNL